jgi:hypothetical protein
VLRTQQPRCHTVRFFRVRYVQCGAHESLVTRFSGRKPHKVEEQVTAEYKRENLVVFREEDPVSSTSYEARTDRIDSSLT